MEIISQPENVNATWYNTKIPVRRVMLLLAFTGLGCAFAFRSNLSLAIVAMIRVPAENSTLPEHAGQCQANSNSSQKKRHVAGGTFDWSEQQKAQILAAFFYGYALTQIPGGYLADRFGGHRIFGIGILGTSALTLLTHPAAYWSPWALVALRFVEGILEGVTAPSILCFWSFWAPIPERTQLIGITFAGLQFGNLVSTPLTGVISAQLGWPWTFYIFGGVGILWSIVWFALASSKPSECRWITTAEREMIEASSANRAELLVVMPEIQRNLPAISDNNDKTRILRREIGVMRQKPPFPWLKFAKCAPFYAICIAHFGTHWGLYVYMTELPSYMSNVLKFNLTQSGVLASLPFAVLWLVQISASYLADKVRNSGRNRDQRTTWVRRGSNFISLILPACFIVCVPLVGCNHTWAVVILTVALSFSGFAYAGASANMMDIASDYAGMIMGIANTLASVAGFVTPLVAAWLTTRNSTDGAAIQTIESWSVFFYVAGGVYAVTGVVSCLLTTGKRLPWLNGYLLGQR